MSPEDPRDAPGEAMQLPARIRSGPPKRNSSRPRPPGPEEWGVAVAAAFSELQEAFERYWERLSTNERRVLAAVAWTGKWGLGTSLLAKDTLERFRLSKSTARSVSGQLVREGELQRLEDGGYQLVDPVLEAWVASDRRART